MWYEIDCINFLGDKGILLTFSIVTGHYPYWIRWTGVDWTAKDKEYMEKTNWHRYDPETEPVLQQVKADVQAGVWRVLEPNPAYEKR